LLYVFGVFSFFLKFLSFFVEGGWSTDTEIFGLESYGSLKK